MFHKNIHKADKADSWEIKVGVAGITLNNGSCINWCINNYVIGGEKTIYFACNIYSKVMAK